jgi:catecholate siderophore receptor
MNSIKTPRSLRGPMHSRPSPKETVAGVGLAAALAVVAPGALEAQTLQLPTVSVTAPAAPKAKKRPPAAPHAASRPAQPRAARAPAPQPAPASAGAAPGPAAPANANPYAAAGAPYNVQRSANARISEPLINTARSITAIPKEVMEDKGATSLRELVRTTPGLTLGTGEGGNAFGDRVFIRGFDARNDMYINGVRESGVSTRETFMAEQVEIMKGPAGSIAGRGTAGGAINVVTKQPTAQNFYAFTAVGGTDLTRRLTTDINHTVNKDLSVRINGLFQEANVAGRNHIHDNRYGGSFASQWKPTEDFKATFDIYHVSMDQMPDWGVPFDPRTRRPFTESGLSRNNTYAVTSRDFQKNSQTLMTQGLEWKIHPDFTLTNKLRYGYTVTDYVASKPGTPNLSNPDPALWSVNATPASRYQVNRTLANQLESTAKFETGGLKHTLVTGFEAQREDVRQDGYSGLTVECNPTCTTGALTNLWNPTTHLLSVTGTPIRNGRPTKTAVDSLSGYVLDTISWNDRLFLNLGGRMESYAITRQASGGALLSRDDLLFNWNAGITYKVLPHASIYAAWSTSSNPVGSELDGGGEDYGSLTAANQVFRPERNTALEAGTKWELFDKKLLLTGALFQTTKEHARETVGAVLQDSAAYRVRGIEFGATGNITDRLSVFGGAVFMESKVTDSAIAANRGRPLANIAHQSINLLAKYKLTDKLSLGAQGTWKGEILGGNLAATYFAAGTVNVGGVNVATPAGYNRLPGGWRFDLMAEYQFDKTFSAKVQVLNLFNKTLYDAFYRSNTPYVYLAPGRSASLTLNAKF